MAFSPTELLVKGDRIDGIGVPESGPSRL